MCPEALMGHGFIDIITKWQSCTSPGATSLVLQVSIKDHVYVEGTVFHSYIKFLLTLMSKPK